jgi:hypothetical protein
MNEAIQMFGLFEIEAIDAITGQRLWKKTLHNALMPINAEVRSKMLMGTYTGSLDDLQIKYFAFGTGTSEYPADVTRLDAEVFRKQITQQSINSWQTDVTTIVSVGANEGNYHIREIGVFAGSAATATANSGTMIARTVVDIDKNSNIILNIMRTDSAVLNYFGG